MSAADKKAPGRNPGAQHSVIQCHDTSVKGRRAISHLWTASRAVQGAKLTSDDRALIHEALAEIAGVVEEVRK